MGKGAQQQSLNPPTKGNQLIGHQKVNLISNFFKKEKANLEDQKGIKEQTDKRQALVETLESKDKREKPEEGLQIKENLFKLDKEL